VRKNLLILAVILVPMTLASGQPPSGAPTPQVRVNYLNVCAPSDEDRQLMASVLDRISASPKFAGDFEVARGRSTLGAADLKLREAESPVPSGQGLVSAPEAGASEWVRIRKEFPEASPYLNAQYSFSMNEGQVVETLTLRARDAKDVMQVAISAASATDNPAQVARLNTPAQRIRLERFGRSSVVLARCPSSDQSRFEPLFSRAGALLAAYRASLAVATVVPAEIARLPKPKPGKQATRQKANPQ
jgi:hypothetical protein